MALLQVHQAKALKDLHEGSRDPGVPQELSAATDLALRAAKVWSLGRVMSTLVVQKRHLWLCLADMRETEKVRFLNSPGCQTGLFGDTIESCAQQFLAAQKQMEAIKHIVPRRSAPSKRPLEPVTSSAPCRRRLPSPPPLLRRIHQQSSTEEPDAAAAPCPPRPLPNQEGSVRLRSPETGNPGVVRVGRTRCFCGQEST